MPKDKKSPLLVTRNRSDINKVNLTNIRNRKGHFNGKGFKGNYKNERVAKAMGKSTAKGGVRFGTRTQKTRDIEASLGIKTIDKNGKMIKVDTINGKEYRFSNGKWQ